MFCYTEEEIKIMLALILFIIITSCEDDKDGKGGPDLGDCGSGA